MNSVRSNNISFKYKRFTLSGCKDEIGKFEFVAKNQVLDKQTQGEGEAEKNETNQGNDSQTRQCLLIYSKQKTMFKIRK